ncbi:GumC family protein [Aurantiacibacter poecillastricola]|uniref:GumC family protein n=1 Tax=Aurantiacibacter poecillastricola TaxID=3064385 RepID=UPI00273F1BC2|nr:division plane positioning ATPase MipZ [Aurantiacibacter sp. 219JJ12-13]MDP5260004.1 AAA family ATPase [Aurantiacibacter sp. 219JJ12-13]
MNIVKSNDGHVFSPPALATNETGNNSIQSPHEFLSIVRRRLRLILGIIVLVMGATALALWLATPIYSASAVMQLDEAFAIDNNTAPNSSPAPIREIEQQTDYSIRVQIDALQSQAVARRVVADLRLHESPEFNKRLPDDAVYVIPEVIRPDRPTVASGDLTFDEAIENSDAAMAAAEVAIDPLADVPPPVLSSVISELQSRINVEQAGTTNYLVVTAQSRDPELAMNIANSVVANYTEERVAELTEKNSRLLADLEVRTEELSDRLSAAESAVADFRRRNNIDASFAEGAGAAEIQGAASAVSLARAESAQANALANRQQSAGSGESALLTNLRNRESQVASELANLSTQYGGAHPDVQRRTAELAEIRSAINAESARVAANVEAARAAANVRAGQIASDLGRLRAQARNQDIVGPQLAALEREVETSNNLYLNMLGRVTELRLRQANQRPEAVPVTSAILPGAPSFPKTTQTLAVAFVAAIILGILMAIVAEAFDNRVRSAEQLRKVTGMPTFAMIPQKGTVPNQVNQEEGGKLTPMSVFAEALRDGFLETVLRTNGKNGRVINIASALPGEGKSTIALGFGATAVEQGMRAIVVDFDFRKRGLTRMLGLDDNETGLDTYLAGKNSLEEAISHSPKLPRLASLTVARTPDNPSALFDAARMEELFTKLREQFDFIVIDTPPVMALRDAKVLAGYSDATVAMARWGKSTAATLKPVMQVLSGKLIGFVITRVDYRKHARFAYNDTLAYYSKYSHYYNSSETEQPGLIKRLLNAFRSPSHVAAN